MKKTWIIGLFIFCIIGASNSATFQISPEFQRTASKCDTAIDIMIDSENEEVAAADMILIFNTGEIKPICFIPGNFLNIGGGMQIDGNKIKVTSYQYPGYAKGKGKFGTLIFRPYTTAKEATIYFDVKKIGINETAGDSNISRPGGGDLLTKAGFAKYVFEEGECKEINKSEFESCKIYNNSESFETFIKNYKKEVSAKTFDYKKIVRKSLFGLILLILIIMKFKNKKNQKEGKK